MRYDVFDFIAPDMTWMQRAWRVLFLLACIAVALLDLFVWRP
jgi:predicted small integral membrane protein